MQGSLRVTDSIYGTWKGNTIDIQHGGTGATEFAANSLIMSGTTTTSALTTRSITDYIPVGATPDALAGKTSWGSGDNTIPTINTIAYWDGRYKSNDNKSNLLYCSKGEFGDAVTYGVKDQTSIGAFSNSGEGLTTERAVHFALLNKGNARIFYGTCATAAATKNKVVICPSYNVSTEPAGGLYTPETGDIIIVKFTNANTTNTDINLIIQNADSNPTLTTTTVAVKCQIVASIINLPSAGYILANRPYMFIYDGTNWILMNINRDNNDDHYDRTHAASGNVKADSTGIGLHRYAIRMLTINNEWSSVSSDDPFGNANNKDDIEKTPANCNFLINSPILYQNGTGGAAPGGTANLDGFTSIQMNLRRGVASSVEWSNLTVQKPVYLIGQVQSDKISFKIKQTEPWWTQELPNSNDGYIYIYLGVASDTINIYLHPVHPIYWHDGIGIKTYEGEASYGAALPLTGREGQVFYQISEPFYEIPAGGTTGQALIKRSNSHRDVEWGNVGGIMRPDDTSKFYLTGSSLTTENADPALFSTSVYVENAKLFGTMWNDYAEFRETKEQIEPGRCIVENGDGTLSLSTARLQGGAEIVSDTYGLAIGKSNICNTPIAVSGRVLAYIEDRTNIKIGAPVCSGPNGTVSQMTEEEARLYPWLIIGTISAIPKEEIWGEGKIQVKNRIWVRVR